MTLSSVISIASSQVAAMRSAAFRSSPAMRCATRPSRSHRHAPRRGRSSSYAAISRCSKAKAKPASFGRGVGLGREEPAQVRAADPHAACSGTGIGSRRWARRRSSTSRCCSPVSARWSRKTCASRSKPASAGPALQELHRLRLDGVRVGQVGDELLVGWPARPSRAARLRPRRRSWPRAARPSRAPGRRSGAPARPPAGRPPARRRGRAARRRRPPCARTRTRAR